MTTLHDHAAPFPALARRRRWRTVVLAIVLFLAGVLTGAGVTFLVGVRSLQYAIRHPEQFPDRAAARLSRRLDLSEQQAAQVRDILARRQANLQAIRRNIQPEVEDELEAARADIAAVLDRHQAAEWNRLYAEKREVWLPPAPPTSLPAPAAAQE